MKKPLPTDLQILDAIYERYYDTFRTYGNPGGALPRGSKAFVPIDIEQIAADFNVDRDIVFGRLYYHLDQKHRYRQDDGSLVSLFTLEAAGDRYCVNFPMLSSVLASLRDDQRKHRGALAIAIASLVLSIVSIIVSVVT